MHIKDFEPVDEDLITCKKLFLDRRLRTWYCQKYRAVEQELYQEMERVQKERSVEQDREYRNMLYHYRHARNVLKISHKKKIYSYIARQMYLPYLYVEDRLK